MKKHDYRNKRWILDFYSTAITWWGESWGDGTNLEARATFLERYAPVGSDILELGAGTGETARYLANHGYLVSAVDITPENIDLIKRSSRDTPSLTPILGDYLAVSIAKLFDVVLLFETFGIGSDADQRRLLERIDREWLKPGGYLLMDVYHPFGPMRDAGRKIDLGPLDQVSTSVAMHEYTDYDLVACRWIDTWEPQKHPENTRVQSFRCYTPADLDLLFKGLDLEIIDLYFDEKKVDTIRSTDETACYDTAFRDTYAYRIACRKKR